MSSVSSEITTGRFKEETWYLQQFYLSLGKLALQNSYQYAGFTQIYSSNSTTHE